MRARGKVGYQFGCFDVGQVGNISRAWVLQVIANMRARGQESDQLGSFQCGIDFAICHTLDSQITLGLA